MTYDRVPPAPHELLRGNFQKRERLGGEPTSRPRGRLEPGSLGKKERLGGEPNTDAMREARARRIADRGWQTLPVHRMPHPHSLRLGGTHECPHCHAVLLNEEEPSFCCPSPHCLAAVWSVQEVLLFTPQHTHKSSRSYRSEEGYLYTMKEERG